MKLIQLLTLFVFLPMTGALADEREDRINAAIPLSIAAQAALEEVHRVAIDRAHLTRIEEQLRTKMRLRALQCSQDYTIPNNLSNEEIRRAHGGEPCYAHADADIAEWLGLRSTGIILSSPILRPLARSSPPFIMSNTAPIQEVHFASKAGVAVFNTFRETQVVDMTTGAPIFTSSVNRDEPLVSVSPNGRLYAAMSGGEIRIHDTQDGRLIASPHWCMVMPGCGFQWLDNRSVLIYSNEDRRSEILDLESGAQAPFDSTVDRVTRIAPVFGTANEFISFTNAGIMRFRLSYIEDQPRIDVLQLDQMALNITPADNGGLDGSGRRYFNDSNGKVYVTSTDTMTTAIVDFGNFFVQRVVPTTDPDKIIVAGYLQGGPSTWTFYQYSLREQALAAIEPAGLLSTQFVYDPALNTLWVKKDNKLALVDTLKVGPSTDLKSFVANMLSAAQRLKTEPVVPPVGAGGIAMVGGIPRIYQGPVAPEPVPGPILEMAKNAEIQGIGVYAAENPNAATSSSRGRYVGTLEGTNVSIYQRDDKQPDSQPNNSVGTVKVKVQASETPLVLVLSSYSRVLWQISLDPGAHLKAILISGPHGSSVSGQGDVRVVAIGNAYSYELGSPLYTLLQNEVFTWTGKHIGLFQCGYQASTFAVAPL